MYQVPTRMLKKYRVPSHLPPSQGDDDTADIPESMPGKRSADKTSSEFEKPHIKPGGQPGPGVKLRIPRTLKDLPGVHSRRLSLESSQKSPPLSSHPLFYPVRGGISHAGHQQRTSTDSTDSGGEISLERHTTSSDKPCPDPRRPDKDTLVDDQREASIHTTSASETCSLESRSSQLSIRPPNASVNAPPTMLANTPSPKRYEMSKHASNKEPAHEEGRSGRLASAPLGQISIRKLSHKFSYVKLRGKFADKTAASLVVTPTRTVSRTASRSVSSTAPSITYTRGFAANRKPNLPPWERSMDVYWERDPDLRWCDLKQLAAFKLSLVKYIKDSNHLMTRNMVDTPYFRLPDAVRLRICKYLVADGGSKTIRMNNIGAYRPVWPDEYFESLQSVLESLECYTAVSSGFRADILVTLFTMRHFHVVWSPYVMPLTSRAAVYYMRRYSSLMQHITLEFDFSKQGFGATQIAASLKPGVENIYPRVDEFVDTQTERDKYSTLFNLRILVRRYHGNRKGGEGVEEGKVPYCGDEHLRVLDSLKCLRGVVERARIVGCSEEYAADLIRYFWEDMPEDEIERAKHCRRIAPSTLYPLLPSQSSYLDYGLARGRHVANHPATFVGSYGAELDEAAMDLR